jgi:Putative heavy-metal-binding
MLTTTTPGIEGHPITEYLGVVTAQGVLGVNAFKDVGAGMRNIFGGRPSPTRTSSPLGSAIRWPRWSTKRPSWAPTRWSGSTSTTRPWGTTC